MGVTEHDIPEAFGDFAENVSAIAQVITFFVFGALIWATGFGGDVWRLVAFIARRAPRSPGRWRSSSRSSAPSSPGAEKAFIAWFGPKGVASMLFALFVLDSSVRRPLVPVLDRRLRGHRLDRRPRPHRHGRARAGWSGGANADGRDQFLTESGTGRSSTRNPGSANRLARDRGSRSAARPPRPAGPCPRARRPAARCGPSPRPRRGPGERSGWPSGRRRRGRGPRRCARG